MTTSAWLEGRIAEADICRAELRRLMAEGLAGRRIEVLCGDTRKRFAAAGEALSWTAFWGWAEGEAFPATTVRQDLLADEIGGSCGEAIRALRWPFRHLAGKRA